LILSFLLSISRMNSEIMLRTRWHEIFPAHPQAHPSGGQPAR
jgi:hypothetical protein